MDATVAAVVIVGRVEQIQRRVEKIQRRSEQIVRIERITQVRRMARPLFMFLLMIRRMYSSRWVFVTLFRNRFRFGQARLFVLDDGIAEKLAHQQSRLFFRHAGCQLDRFQLAVRIRPSGRRAMFAERLDGMKTLHGGRFTSHPLQLPSGFRNAGFEFADQLFHTGFRFRTCPLLITFIFVRLKKKTIIF